MVAKYSQLYSLSPNAHCSHNPHRKNCNPHSQYLMGSRVINGIFVILHTISASGLIIPLSFLSIFSYSM